MLSPDENKPTGKSGQRKGKTGQQSRKAKQRNPKPDQQQDPKPDQLPDVREEISALAASIDRSPTEAFPGETSLTEIAASPTETSVTVTSPIGQVEPAEVLPVGFQTIAKAYGDYTRKSLEQTRSLFEKLACERSVVTAFELQVEFARKAYETFATDSQKIRELHSELARQRLRRLEGFVDQMTQTALAPWAPPAR